MTAKLIVVAVIAVKFCDRHRHCAFDGRGALRLIDHSSDAPTTRFYTPDGKSARGMGVPYGSPNPRGLTGALSAPGPISCRTTPIQAA